MAYSVTTNNGDVITVNDEAKDSSSLSLTVIGRNATNYGQTIFTNTVRQLENFAGNTPPSATYLPSWSIMVRQRRKHFTSLQRRNMGKNIISTD